MISVIIPMYNAEKYVEKCLNSLLKQTYQDLEIIIVNDGSKDYSREICEEYVKKDKRITLINTENRGAGSARNTGIEASKGEYISFIDSDDYVCPDYYERFLKMIEHTGADIAIGRYERISEHGEMKFINSGEIKECTNMEELMILYGEDVNDYINAVLVTNKLYKRELFEGNIRFPVGRLIDDEFIIYKLIYKANKIVYTDDVMYAYVQSDSSIMRTNFKEQRVYDTMDVYDEVYAFFKEHGNKELCRKILTRYLDYCGEMARRTSTSTVIDEKDKSKIYEYLEGKFEEKTKDAKELIELEKYENFYKEFYSVVNKNKDKLSDR